jgi:hypothetical protein
MQLVMPGRTLLHGLRHWRAVRSGLGNVSHSRPRITRKGLTSFASLFVAVGQTLLMMSLAEFCTIWPTAGGQQ